MSLASSIKPSPAVSPSWTDPLMPSSSWFSLGRAFGIVEPSQSATPQAAVPFGASLAVAADATRVDYSIYGFDHASQTATVTVDGQVLPVLKHTDGNTKTVTHPDGKRMNDADDDARED